MASDRPERRLAAIMFTDIVGYTALMAESEEKGLRARTLRQVAGTDRMLTEPAPRLEADPVACPHYFPKIGSLISLGITGTK